MADDFDLSVKIARILIENGISSEPSLDYNIHSWRCERSTTQCTCFADLVEELSNVLDKP